MTASIHSDVTAGIMYLCRRAGQHSFRSVTVRWEQKCDIYGYLTDIGHEMKLIIAYRIGQKNNNTMHP